MAKNALLPIGEVKLVETKGSKECLDGARVKAVIDGDNPRNLASIPWAVPLLPKVFQSIPKVGEAVIILTVQMGESKWIAEYEMNGDLRLRKDGDGSRSPDGAKSAAAPSA